jgi:hypothetical protein
MAEKTQDLPAGAGSSFHASRFAEPFHHLDLGDKREALLLPVIMRRRRRLVAWAGAFSFCFLGLVSQLLVSTRHPRHGWAGEVRAGVKLSKDLEAAMLKTVSISVRNSTSPRTPPESFAHRGGRPNPPRSHSRHTDDGSNRSTLVIHVGPPKVGSTYIQCSLCGASASSGRHQQHPNDRSLASFLAQDSFVFLGTCPWRVCGLASEPDWNQVVQHRFEGFMTRNLGLSHLIGPQLLEDPTPSNTAAGAGAVATNSTSTIQPDLLRRLDRLQDRGLNGLLVYEGLSVFDSLWIAQLSAYLRRMEWKVTIVVAYRPLFAWLPSKYNSVSKVGKNPAVRYWLDDPVCQTIQSGCHGIEPFSLRSPRSGGATGRLADKFAAYVAHLEAARVHPAHITYLNYKSHFEDVRILPLHRLVSSGMGDPMLEHLFCVSIDTAPETCHAIRTLKYAEIASRNPFDSSQDYDRLVVHAYETNLYDRSRWNVSRSNLREWAREFHRIHLLEKPLPRTCMNQSELDRLEQLSWHVERNLFQNVTGGGEPGEDAASEALHHAEFTKAVQKRQAYCWVDTNRTVQEDPQWRAFFESPYDPSRGRPEAAPAPDTGLRY